MEKNKSRSLILSAISLTGELKHSHWQLLVLFYGNCYFSLMQKKNNLTGLYYMDWLVLIRHEINDHEQILNILLHSLNVLLWVFKSTDILLFLDWFLKMKPAWVYMWNKRCQRFINGNKTTIYELFTVYMFCISKYYTNITQI